MKVEPARPDDLPQLRALLALLFEAEAEFEADTGKQEAALQAVLSAPELGRIFVIREGDRIVAMASLLFTISTAEGGRAAWLEDVIVAPDRRASGVGTALIASVISAARELGCLRLTLLTDATNAGAQIFYARAGFAPSRMIPMRLKLPPA